MDPVLLLWLVVGAVVVLVIALAVWMNAARVGMVRADRSAAEAWESIRASVAERNALGTTLAERAAAPADRPTVEAATAAMSASAAARDPEAAAAAEAAVGPALHALAGAAKADTTETAALAAAEDAIQSARRAYNHAVREVQRRSRSFPGSLFAGRIERRAFFEVQAAGQSAAPPRVQF